VVAGAPEPPFVEIPAGEFWMGQDDGRDEERPAHRVRLDTFRLGAHQVTNAEYDRFVAASGRAVSPLRDKTGLAHLDQPVVAVSWFDATAYCEWLAARLALPVRLPTEAEWEYAARGGLAGKLYPWGDEPPQTRPDYARRWLDGPEPVGTSPPNGYGLFDMCENVHEWCADWYDAGWYAVSPVDDPRGPASGKRRASRGGAWRHEVKIARCAARSSIPPQLCYEDYGFRVACG
jgi:formylglycine-generating enzyme required for sulfatase activity